MSLLDTVIITLNHQKNIAAKNYYEESPQLPYGYPASILLSLVPPLWFYMMNPLVPDKMKKA